MFSHFFSGPGCQFKKEKNLLCAGIVYKFKTLESWQPFPGVFKIIR